AGIILLVIGAGGVFKQVLVDSGVGPALGEALTGMGLPIAITCYEAEIRDDQNRPLPAGEIGEICIKGIPGKTIFKEYYMQPEAT
ncbi:AMP-binding protein, partial [Salmonella enterica subsp. enterica serovar Virginia]|nr:AMP-binding protein [Salmonella enterica subsp. enterica serovar Virginia]